MKKFDLPKPEIIIDQGRKTAAMEQIRQAAKACKMRYTPSRLEILESQVTYISPGFWLGQGAFFLLAAILFLSFRGSEGKALEYLITSSVLAAGVGIVGILEMGRSMAFRMAELEQSCYLNLRQIWGIKMALSGCINVCILSGMAAGLHRESELGILPVCLYLLVPFVVSNAGYLLVLSIGRNPGRKWTQLAVAVFMGAAAMIPAAYPKVYKAVYLPAWAVILAAGVLLVGIEVYALMSKISSGGGKLCWN